MNRRNFEIGDWVTANNLVGQVVEKGLDSQREEFWIIWSGDSLPMNELATSLHKVDYEGEDLAGTEFSNGRVNRLVYEYGVKAEVYKERKRKPELWTLEKLNQELNNDEPQSVTPTFNTPTTLSLSLIRRDGGTQSRAAINATTVDEYADDYKNGANFPPITVFYDGEFYWLVDGFHREKAASKAGLTEIAAIIKQGTRRDAVLYSVGVNATHGLRRTNADKRRSVMTLLEDEEWSQLSDRKIARKCGVSHDFVNRLRKSICHLMTDTKLNNSDESICHLMTDTKLNNSDDSICEPYTDTKLNNKRKVERGGKTYIQDTTNIGKRSSSESLPPSAFEKELNTPSEEVQSPSEEKFVTTPTSSEENNPPEDAPLNIRNLLSVGDRVRIKDDHYFGGLEGTVTLIPNRESAVVEFAPGKRELIKLEDFDLPTEKTKADNASADNASADNATTDNATTDNATTDNEPANNVPADNEPPNIRKLLSVGDLAKIKDDHEFGGQQGIVTFIPDRHRAVVELSAGNRKIIQLEDFDFSATQKAQPKPQPQRPVKKEIIIKEGLNYKAGCPGYGCKWYVEVEEKTYQGLKEYRSKVGTITLDAAIARFLEAEKEKTPNSDDIMLYFLAHVEQLPSERVNLVLNAFAEAHYDAFARVYEVVKH